MAFRLRRMRALLGPCPLFAFPPSATVPWDEGLDEIGCLRTGGSEAFRGQAGAAVFNSAIRDWSAGVRVETSW